MLDFFLAMEQPATYEVTELLQAWSNGDAAALERLTPVIHGELHRIAKRYMSKERPDHTLQPTALVNEAYLRLINWKTAQWANRAHFFGVSAQLMRRILVDFARNRPHREGKAALQVSLTEALAANRVPNADLIALDEALDGLAKLDPRKARIIELRFFGGLSVDETAEILQLAPITIIREWNKAKAWLYRELHGDD